MTERPCLLGYYFAREKDSDKITCVAGWGDTIEKDVKGDVEIIEQIPPRVVSSAVSGVKILNLRKMMKLKER